MDCIECKTTNLDGNRYCGKCGAQLNWSLEETAQKKFRDRKSIEIDIAQSVAARLMKWTGWITKIAVLFVALFGLLLGKSYYDIRTQVKAGRQQIEAAVADGKKEIGTVKQEIAPLKEEVKQVRSDTEGYKQANVRIANLQKQILDVRDQVIDLGSKAVKAKTFTATGEGFSTVSLGTLGCAALPPKGFKLSICAQGSPPVLTQVSISGESAPVASRSPVGFQDTSIGEKPSCAANHRGTFYVEKGATDKAFLCGQKASGEYDWMELAIR
jgi:hypothetical protein